MKRIAKSGFQPAGAYERLELEEGKEDEDEDGIQTYDRRQRRTWKAALQDNSLDGQLVNNLPALSST
jgi:hypothetical protein